MTQRPSTTYRPSLSHLADAAFEDRGWRSFFTYRDLGVKEATGRDYDVRIVRSGHGQPEQTGWHFHVLCVQVVFCVAGWEFIALEDGTVAKLVPGSCLQIPPGYVHNEIGYAPDMEMFVLTAPADAETVPAEAPAGWDADAVAAALASHRQPGNLGDPWVWRT